MLKNSPNMAGASVTKRDDPRPLTVEQYFNYSKEQRENISKLTPGLTGIGSLIFRDEESIMEKSGMDYNEIHDTIIAEYKGNLESWFYDNNTLINYYKRN